jgi:hypothetical protein
MNLSFPNVDSFCASIDLSADRPLIDLSSLQFIEPFAVIYLGQFIRYHNRYGKYVDVKMPPSGSQVRKYLARVRFWERFRFSADVIEREGLLRFSSTTSLNDIVDIVDAPYADEDVYDMVAEVLRRGTVKTDAKTVLMTVSELVDNFAQHADVDLATLAVQYYPNLHRFVVAIGDSGEGIRATLSRNPEYAYLADRPHSEALAMAFEPLVSQHPNRGMGLTDVLEGVVACNGSLRVASNNGYFYIERGKRYVGDQQYDLPGVQIELWFPER